MQKNLCLGLGVVLFGLAALLFIAGSVTSDSSYRIVSSNEAMVIVGGGQKGNAICDLQGQTCNNANSGCTGKGPFFSGELINQGFVPTGFVYCGGANCSATTLYGGQTNAPE